MQPLAFDCAVSWHASIWRVHSAISTPPAPCPAATLPAEWGSWAELKRFSLAAGPLAGALPDAWSSWGGLDALSLRGAAGVAGPLPPAWTNASAFPLLRELELAGMPNVSASWAALTPWLAPKAPAMRRLVLSGLGGLAGAGLEPSLISTASSNLSVLVLSDLNAGGGVPDWSGLPQGGLSVLDLSGNNLTGPLPLWAAGALGVPPPPPEHPEVMVQPPPPGSPPPAPVGWLLDLSRNAFTGACVLRARGRGLLVCSLEASWLRLRPTPAARPAAHARSPCPPASPPTGGLPSSWSAALPANASGQHVIRLGSNQLTGTPPASWQALVWTAAAVDLSRNLLNGPLPAEWNATEAMGNTSSHIVNFNARLMAPAPL